MTITSRASSAYIAQINEHGESTITFALKDGIGVLSEVLKIFHDERINLKKIESRSSKKFPDSYEFEIIFEGFLDATKAIEQLRESTLYLDVITREKEDNNQSTLPWFPRRIRDLDTFAKNVVRNRSDNDDDDDDDFHLNNNSIKLDQDHPGFKDKEYLLRREYFANIALQYKHGDPIPRVEYTQQEIDTWTHVFDRVVPLYRKFACKEFNHIFPLMEENCNYRRDNIPQLEDVNKFLKDHTGFTLRPVAGLLSSRDFLAGLAFRVFHSTQYIRHPAKPDYTPEPDVCHELLGHAPLFADPDFAKFSQEIGLASLGAPDEYIEKLATCYWFTIEFGLCKEQDSNEIKAYGAGLLSSFGELEYAMSDKPKILPFDPDVTGLQTFPVCEFQPVYFLAESFDDAQRKLHEYALTIPKPTVFRYNPYTQSVETLDNMSQFHSFAKEIKSDVALIVDCLKP